VIGVFALSVLGSQFVFSSRFEPNPEPNEEPNPENEPPN